LGQYTGYHWYIVARQNVYKENANDYTTSLTGLKYKVAHKRADRNAWSSKEKTQRKRMIAFLKGVIDDLEQQQAEEEKSKRAPRTKKKTAGR
jgi:hypothetical protein